MGKIARFIDSLNDEERERVLEMTPDNWCSSVGYEQRRCLVARAKGLGPEYGRMPIARVLELVGQDTSDALRHVGCAQNSLWIRLCHRSGLGDGATARLVELFKARALKRATVGAA